MTTDFRQNIFSYWKQSSILFISISFILPIILQGRITIPVIIIPLLATIIYLTIKRYSSKYSQLGTRQILIRVFVISAIVRLLTIPIYNNIYESKIGVPFQTYKDEFVYDKVARALAEDWRTNNWTQTSYISFSKGNYSGYPIFSGFMMYVFGTDRLTMKIVNSMIGALIAVIGTAIALQLYKEQIKIRIVSSLFIFNPLLIRYSASNFKDNLLLLVLILCLLVVILSLNRKKPIYLLFIPVLLLPLTTLRTAAIIIFILALVLALVVGREGKTSNKYFTVLFAIVGVVMMQYIWSALSVNLYISDWQSYFNNRFGHASIVDSNAMISSTSIRNVLSTPLFIAGSYFVPVPTVVDLYGPSGLASDGEYIFNFPYDYLFMISWGPAIIIGSYYAFKSRDRSYLVIAFFVILYKIVLANSQMILSGRHNMPAFAFSLLLIPLCGQIFLENKGKKYLYSIFAVQVLALLAFNYVRYAVRQV